MLAQEWIEPYSATRLEALLARIRSERILESLNRVSDPTSSERPTHPPVRLEVKEGILRAVDLDRKKLSLDQDNGIKTPLTLAPVGLEELLGLMLNKRVVVTGYIPPRRKRWIVTDIDFAPAA